MKLLPIFSKTSLLLGVLALFGCQQASAAVITVLNENFQTNNTLASLGTAGWKAYGNVAPATPPLLGRYAIGSTGSNTFLQAWGAAGVTAPLSQPIAIDASIVSVTMSIDVMGTSNTAVASSVLKVALTSRLFPAPTTGDAFATGLDSGFSAQGYGNANTANFLRWRINGTDTQYTPSPNVKFVPQPNVWTNWKMVYSVQDSTLSFYLDNGLVATQTGVNLAGVTLNSLWLANGGIETFPNSYDNLLVSYQTVPEGGAGILFAGGVLLILAYARKTGLENRTGEA